MVPTDNNPFPSDEEVAFLQQLTQELFQLEFRQPASLQTSDQEKGMRCLALGQCLGSARKANGWTAKDCARQLSISTTKLRQLESSSFDNSNAPSILDYVRLLGLEALYQKWVEANPDCAQQLGLPPRAPVTTRPLDWPAPAPYWPEPDIFRLSPEKRQLLQNQLKRMQSLLTELRPPSQEHPAAQPRRRRPLTRNATVVYQLKITLRHVKPAVWRRILVPSHLTLGELHPLLQIVMGWHNCHLHEFNINDERFGVTNDPWGGGAMASDECLNEDEYQLCDLGLRPNSRFSYEYDFGDGWEHEVLLEKQGPVPPGFSPVCIEGANACPPEDCGGPWGYAENLAILAHPKHPEHKHITEWMGKTFDPKAFSVESVNRMLAPPKKQTRKSRR